MIYYQSVVARQVANTIKEKMEQNIQDVNFNQISVTVFVNVMDV